MRFRNRADAGRKLATALFHYKSQRPIVLALLRGGVPVAAEVAAALGSPLDIVLVRKIGAPMQPELAIGAVVDGGDPIVVHNPEVERLTDTTPEQFEVLCQQELTEIERRRRRFLGNRTPLDPRGRVVIVIDDGIATGATMRAALQATRTRKPAKLVLAVPVAPTEMLQDLRQEVDEVICLTRLEPFGAVGYFYDDFRQLSDDDVIDVLDHFHMAPVP
jgi:putative phosphoribosyl transferase